VPAALPQAAPQPAPCSLLPGGCGVLPQPPEPGCLDLLRRIPTGSAFGAIHADQAGLQQVLPPTPKFGALPEVPPLQVWGPPRCSACTSTITISSSSGSITNSLLGPLLRQLSERLPQQLPKLAHMVLLPPPQLGCKLAPPPPLVQPRAPHTPSVHDS
jgi:hypothetical protein